MRVLQKFVVLLSIFYSCSVTSITISNLYGEMDKNNEEIKAAKNKIRHSEFGVTAARSSHYPALSFNNAVSKGSNFKYNGSTASTGDISAPGGDALASGINSEVGSINNSNEGWSSDISVSLPLFTRFAAQSSINTSKFKLSYDEHEKNEISNGRRADLIKLILEINMLQDISEPLNKAKSVIQTVKNRSSLTRTKTLYNKRDLLELDTKYYELKYQISRVSGSLALAKSAMYDLIPNFKDIWFTELPKIKIKYTPPREDLLLKNYISSSISDKKDRLEIASSNEIYSATKWERAWIPVVMASGSYGSTGSFEKSETSNSWRASLGVTFELFDGFRSQARRGQALHSKLMAEGKRKINTSKQLLYLKHSYMIANVSMAEYLHKLALSEEKKHKYKQSIRISNTGASTSFEQSVLLLDYTMAKLDAFNALKKHQSAIVNIATKLNKLKEVKVYETN